MAGGRCAVGSIAEGVALTAVPCLVWVWCGPVWVGLGGAVEGVVGVATAVMSTAVGVTFGLDVTSVQVRKIAHLSLTAALRSFKTSEGVVDSLSATSVRGEWVWVRGRVAVGIRSRLLDGVGAG